MFYGTLKLDEKMEDLTKKELEIINDILQGKEDDLIMDLSERIDEGLKNKLRLIGGVVNKIKYMMEEQSQK